MSYWYDTFIHGQLIFTTRYNIDTTNEWIRLLVWKKIFWKWLIPNNGKSSSHQQSDWCRLIADWLQAFHLHSCVILEPGLSHAHTQNKKVLLRRCCCICCFKGLKHTWSTLGPRARLLVPHGLNPGFQVSLPFKCTLQWHRCHFFRHLVSRILFKIMAVSCLRIHHRVFVLAATLPCSSWPPTTEMVGFKQE